jgi:hypothetical protein
VKKNRATFIILFAVLGGALLLYFIYSDDDKRFQWYESYRTESDQPYGTLFIRKMLEGYRSDGKLVLNEKTPVKHLLDSTKGDSYDYVFIGQSLFLDEEDVVALGNFMDSGGDVFIASLGPPELLLNSVYFKECDAEIRYEESEADTVSFNFLHETLSSDTGFQYTYRYGSDNLPYSWSVIGEQVFCDSTQTIVALGNQKDRGVNFVKIAVGKGNLYLHSNPLAFTNYFLVKPDKVDYASGVFSHLSGKNIIWDEYSKIPFNGNKNAYNSPLYYILQQPSLKYAWWLLLVTVFLYILFAAKRQQRVIPVLEPKTNTSLEFVNLIAKLHYRNENHVDMARKKMKYFLYFVRSKYGIHAEKFDDQQVRKLAEKSKIPEGDVRAIFDQYAVIEEKFQHTIEANRLLTLYYSIDNFYTRCK